MGLSYNDFTSIIVRRSAETQHALSDHKARDADRMAIEKQIAEFQKRGRKIDVLPPNIKTHLPPAVVDELEVAIKNLKASFGKNLNIRPHGVKFKSFYLGQELGEHTTIKKAAAAIKRHAIKHRNDKKGNLEWKA